MFHIGHAQSKQTRPALPRADGQSDYNAAIVRKFQSVIERESDCDYSALAAALLWARDERSHVITMQNLRAVYNRSISYGTWRD